MYWKEDIDSKKEFVVPDDVLDMTFGLECKCLPIDHAQSLSDSIQDALPWFGEEALTGLHLIHVAESGNGWMRPEDPENEILCLSRRTRMTLRVPKHRIDDAHSLTGQVLDIDGYELKVKDAKQKELSPLPTMFARYVVTEESQDENQFMQHCAEVIAEMGIPISKMMAGKQHKMRMHDGDIFTRSLMLADLTPEHAIKLQQEGIGPGRKYGCGLFIPQKGISAVKRED
jgi:CRISPR-associated protein Cas6